MSTPSPPPHGKGSRGPGPQLPITEQDVAVSLPVPATPSTPSVGTDSKGGPKGKSGKYDGYYYGGGYGAPDAYAGGYHGSGYSSYSGYTGHWGKGYGGGYSSWGEEHASGWYGGYDAGYGYGKDYGKDGQMSKGSNPGMGKGYAKGFMGKDGTMGQDGSGGYMGQDNAPGTAKGQSSRAGNGSSPGTGKDASLTVSRSSLDNGGTDEASVSGMDEAHSANSATRIEGRPRRPPDYEVLVEISPRIQPSFRRGPENTFVFELGPLNVRVAATCKHRQPKDRERGEPDISSENEIVLKIPEVQEVVFDPATEQPAKGTATGSATTYGTILQLPRTLSLGAQIKLNSASGTLVLEDRRMANGQRQKIGENTLHYKLQVDGQLPITTEGADDGMHCLGVSLQLAFTCIFEMGSNGFPAHPQGLRRPAASSRPVVDAGTGGGGGQLAAARPAYHGGQAGTGGQPTPGAQPAGAEEVE